jgi:hypothetical protein
MVHARSIRIGMNEIKLKEAGTTILDHDAHRAQHPRVFTDKLALATLPTCQLDFSGIGTFA